MLNAGSPSRIDTVVDMVEGRRRLIEATREAARWRTPPRRIQRKQVSK